MPIASSKMLAFLIFVRETWMEGPAKHWKWSVLVYNSHHLGQGDLHQKENTFLAPYVSLGNGACTRTTVANHNAEAIVMWLTEAACDSFSS